MPHFNQTGWDSQLKAALAQAPASGYAQDGSQDDQIAAALNAATVDGPNQLVPIENWLSYLVEAGKWPGIVAAANAATPNAAAQIAVGLGQDWMRLKSIDTTSAAATTTLAALAEAGLISSDDSAALLAMGQTKIPWWQSIAAPAPLNQYDIARAREA